MDRHTDVRKIIWQDGISMSLYAKRLECGRFICLRRRPGLPDQQRSRTGIALRGLGSKVVVVLRL